MTISARFASIVLLMLFCAQILRAETPAMTKFAALPLHFEANQGQTDSRVRFLARGSGYSLLLADSEAVLRLRGMGDVRMSLVGNRRSPRVTGEDKLAGTVNYFLGKDPKKWRTDIPTFARVRYEQVYPGIDLVYYGDQSRMEYDFVVAPESDPTRIRMKLGGVHGIELGKNGDLSLKTSGGVLTLQKPQMYQELEGLRQNVDGSFKILQGEQIGFSVGSYDPSVPLVIDPVLVYASFLGGPSSSDVGQAIAVDGTGAAYITGYTYSIDFPGSASIQQYTANSDVFIAKVNAAGSGLVFSTYLGGLGWDYGYSVAVDASLNVLVAGTTSSSDFPVLSAFQSSFRGNNDAFLTKLNAAGNALVYSTYLGGDSSDQAGAVAVHQSTGNVYVVGSTSSSNFPIQAAFQPVSGGFTDAFVAKFSPTGSPLFSTYLGGSSTDVASAGTVDSAGNPFVAGYTCSTNFPITPASSQTLIGGGCDAFVTKLNSTGTAALYSTFLGGSSFDIAYGVAADASGAAYVTGDTESSNFPVTAGVVQTALQGGTGFDRTDGFVTKLTPDGASRAYSTYIGGRFADIPQAIAVDGSGRAIVTGYTYSTNFPNIAAVQPVKPGARNTLFKTTNGGALWTASDAGLTSQSSNAVLIDGADPSTILVGTYSGLHRSTDGGANWTFTLARSISALLQLGSSFYLNDFNDVYTSSNGGQSWLFKGSVPTSVAGSAGIQTFAGHPSTPTTLYAGTGSGIYKSTDSGSAWNPINNGLTNLYVRRLAVDPSNASVVYAGTSAGIFKSSNGGASWTPINNGAFETFIYAIAIDPSAPATVYASFGGSLYKTVNGGQIWTSVSPPFPVQSLGISPANPSILYAGTFDDGVFKSSDGGVTWNAANGGIEVTSVPVLAVDPTNAAVVYIGTGYLDTEAFVSKLNSTATALVYSTFVGGSSFDIGYGVASDSAGNAYVTGYSSSVDFPNTPGAFQPTSRLYDYNAFVVKISDATPGCSYQVRPNSFLFYPIGTRSNSNALTVLAPSGCPWTASTTDNWIRLGTASGTGTATVRFSVAANSGASRNGTIVVGGTTVNIIQAASGCTYSLSPSFISAPLAGGSSSVTLNTGAGCQWEVQSLYPWVTVNTTAGSGPTALTFTVASNAGYNSRGASIDIGATSLFILQPGTCTFGITPTSGLFPAVGGAGVVALSASNPACIWSAYSNNEWFSVSPNSGLGSAILNFTVSPNASIVPRSTTLTFAGQTYTVIQNGLPLGNTPSVLPPSPASGSGLTQTFGFTFVDNNGATDVDVVNILINNFLDGRVACYLAYSRPLNVLYLVNNPGTALLPGLVLNGSGSVNNSQCGVTGAGSSATITGNTLTLTLAMTFSASFAGNKVIHQAARDMASNNSGWVQQGVWNVPGGAPASLAVVSMTPSRGGGSTYPFNFTLSDVQGYTHLVSTTVLVNDYLDGGHACYLGYHVPSNTVFLLNDLGNGYLSALPLGGAGSVENSQCRILAAGSGSSGAGNNLTLTLVMEFKSGFAGNRVFYLSAQDGTSTSGWQMTGSWTVP